MHEVDDEQFYEALNVLADDEVASHLFEEIASANPDTGVGFSELMHLQSLGKPKDAEYLARASDALDDLQGVGLINRNEHSPPRYSLNDFGFEAYTLYRTLVREITLYQPTDDKQEAIDLIRKRLSEAPKNL